MGRRGKAALLLLIFLVSLLIAAVPGLGYSDGFAGGSGAIAENQRQCQGVEFCKVVPAYCGGCHGSYDEMRQQEGAAQTPQEKVNGDLTFSIDGDAKAGTSSGRWEYSPGERFTIDIKLPDARPSGRYASGGFDLNASAGILSVVPGDANVRITGGLFQHAGTKNPDIPLGPSGQRYGAILENEMKWAGEATTTAKGSEVRAWKVRFQAPAVQVPHGLAFVMTAMLPNGDGLDSCTNNQCNSSQGAAPQREWDWYSFMVPRRMMCERGFFPDYAACQKAVAEFILPPSPPLNTACPPNTGCPTPTSEAPSRGTPAVDPLIVVGLVGLAGFVLRRRR